MAGIDLDAMRSGTIPGLGRVEGGRIDFSAGSRTVEVVTRLNTYWMGFAIADTTQSGSVGQSGTLVATTDGDISASNITFTRHGLTINADARFRYMLIGW